jgi:hypothetical protein
MIRLTWLSPAFRLRRKISNVTLSRLLTYLILTSIGLLAGHSCWQYLQGMSSRVRTTRSLNRPSLLNYTHERYELMGKYDQESLYETDPQFKRILFWNEVRNIFDIAVTDPAKLVGLCDYNKVHI